MKKMYMFRVFVFVFSRHTFLGPFGQTVTKEAPANSQPGRSHLVRILCQRGSKCTSRSVERHGLSNHRHYKNTQNVRRTNLEPHLHQWDGYDPVAHKRAWRRQQRYILQHPVIVLLPRSMVQICRETWFEQPQTLQEHPKYKQKLIQNLTSTNGMGYDPVAHKKAWRGQQRYSIQHLVTVRLPCSMQL